MPRPRATYITSSADCTRASQATQRRARAAHRILRGTHDSTGTLHTACAVLERSPRDRRPARSPTDCRPEGRSDGRQAQATRHAAHGAPLRLILPSRRRAQCDDTAAEWMRARMRARAPAAAVVDAREALRLGAAAVVTALVRLLEMCRQLACGGREGGGKRLRGVVGGRGGP